MEEKSSLDKSIFLTAPITFVFSIICLVLLTFWSPADFPNMEGTVQKIWDAKWGVWFTFFISGLITTCQFAYRGPDIKSKGN